MTISQTWIYYSEWLFYWKRLFWRKLF